MRSGFLAWLLGALLTVHPPAGQPDQVATFTVGQESFRVLLTHSEDIAGARAVMSGESNERIPVGEVRRDSSEVNTGYDWHLDPNEFTWTEYASARCNVLPSDVQNSLVIDRFCPWLAKLIDLQPHR